MKDGIAPADIEEAYRRFPGDDTQSGATRYGFLEGVRRGRASARAGVDGWEAMQHPNGAPMFSRDGTLLDDRGKRSIFDDVDR